MNDMTKNAAASNAYAQREVYADNNAHRGHNAYKQDNPYKKDDVYSKGRDDDRERAKPWALDFEIIRFFRENFNAGIDFEESPRVFFDEEHMFNLRIKLLSRNFTTMIVKFIYMVLFSSLSIFLTSKGVMIVGFIYLVAFLYYIAVPIAFVKYARQYIIDDTEHGKLKKIHLTYSKWLRPLEAITMNTFTVVFVLIEIIMLFNIKQLHEYMNMLSSYTHIQTLIAYVNSIQASAIQNSILITTGFYIFAYLVYWIFIYKIWVPKWEKVRKINEKAFTRTNQRMAKNLKDELTKGVD